MKRFLFITLLTVLSYSITPAGFAIGGSIASSPAKPSAGQKVKLRYVTPVTTNIKWDFGDDSNACNAAASVFTHVFTEPGTYTVRAWDTFCDDGAAPTATKTIIVDGSGPAETAFEILSGELLFKNGTPSITVHKNETGLRAKVTLRGDGSGRARLQWLLDGQPFSSQIKKVDFSRQRSITIELNRDLPTQIPGSSHTVSLRIQEPRSPKLKIADISYGVDRPAFGAAAGFAVSYIELRFKNRSAYMNVEKNRRDFKAYADFKCEGAGTLQVQWLVDGKPFFIQSKSVNFAESVTIDSGRNLPTLVNGSHTVSIRLLSPQTRLKIPVIKYLVGGEPGAEAPKYNVDIRFKSYQDNLGKANMLSGTTLKAKQGEYLILNGEVINKGKDPIPKGYMNAYIDGKLIATQAINRIPPGGLVPFNTSLQFPDVQKSQVEFRFSDKLGELIQNKQLRMLSGALNKTQDQLDISLGEVKIINFSTTKPVVSAKYSMSEGCWEKPAIEVFVQAEGVEKAAIFIPGYIYVDRGNGVHVTMDYRLKLDAEIVNGIINQRISLPIKYSKHGEEIHYGLHSKDDRYIKIEKTLPYSKHLIPIELQVYGKDSKGKKSWKDKTINQIIIAENGKQNGKPIINDFHAYSATKTITFRVKDPFELGHLYTKQKKIKVIEFRVDVAKENYFEIRHLKTGHKMTPPYTYMFEIKYNNSFVDGSYSLRPETDDYPKDFTGFDAGDAVSAGYYNMKNWLPGPGWYELKAYNSQGVTTARTYVTTVDTVYNNLLKRAKEDGCTRIGNAGEVTIRTGGFGNCDISTGEVYFKDGKIHLRSELPEEMRSVPECKRYKCDPWFECVRYNCKTFNNNRKLILQAEGYGVKPHIDVFKVEGTTVAADGEQKNILISFSDTRTGELKNDTKVVLYAQREGSRQGKKQLFSRTIKAGSKAQLITYAQLPKATTYYSLVVSNRWGKTEAKIAIVMLPAKQPIIEYFQTAKNPSTIKSGDTVTLKYKFQNAVGDAKIIDPLTNKVLERIRPDKGGKLKGVSNWKITATRSFALVLNDRNGEAVRQKIRIKITNQHGRPGEITLPKFYTVNATKAGSTITKIRPGEAFYLNAKFSGADEAFVFAKWSGTEIAELAVFKPGDIGTSRAIVRVPAGFKGDAATFTIRLSNSDGTKEEHFTIAVDHGLSLASGSAKNSSDNDEPKETKQFDSKNIPQGLVFQSQKDIFYSNLQYIKKGESITLGWEIENALSASYGKQNGIKTSILLSADGNAKGTVTLTPAVTSNYVLEVKRANGLSSTTSTYVMVEQPKGTYPGEPVIKTFDLSGTTFNNGDSCRINYSFKDAFVAYINYHDSKTRSDVNFSWLPVEATPGVYSKGSVDLKVTPAMTDISIITYNKQGQVARRKAIQVKNTSSGKQTARKGVNNTAKPSTERLVPGAGGIDSAGTTATFDPSKAVKTRNYQKKPIPSIFDQYPFRQPIKAGESCTIQYAFKNAETAFIKDKKTGKRLKTLKVDPTPGVNNKGFLEFSPTHTTTYVLVLTNVKGSTDPEETIVVK